MVHQRKWRTHLNTLRPDTGIPEGLRISIGGEIRIVDRLGGSVSIEYETFRLRKSEAFLVFIDSKEVLKVGVGNEVDSAGYSKQRSDSSVFELSKGRHLI